MADGEIKIKVVLDGKDAEQGIKALEVTLKSLSGVSSVFGKLGGAVGTFGKSFQTLGGIIGGTAGKVTAGLGLVVAAYDKLYEASKQNFIGNLEKYGQVFVKIGSIAANVAGQVVGALASIGGAPTSIEDVITSFANFTNRMQEVRAITGATNSEFEQMYNLARKLGRDTLFSSLEVADAFKALGMAGMSVTDSMNALPSVLRLSRISGMALGDTAGVLSDNLISLGMASTDAGDMVDMMATTITSSNTDLEQMKDALSYSSQLAGTLGINFEDLALGIALMANNGVKGSKAGTAMRTMLTNLSAPTSNAAAAMEKYGIALKETTDGSIDFDATMISLREGLKGLPLKEQAAAAKALFGKTGLAGGLAVVNASDAAYNKLKGEIAGSTERMTYWKQECEKAGLSQEETAKKLESLQTVFEESKDMADGLNISSTSLTKSISLLGEDGKVTSDNIEKLFESFVNLGNASDKQLSAMEQYGISLSKNKDGSLDYDKSITSVVKSLRGKTEAEKRAILTQIGLADSFEELNELSNITPKRYDEITKSIEKTQSAAEKAEKIINESLTFSAEQMASTLDDLGIVLMSKVAPALADFCDWVTRVAGLMAQGQMGKAFTEFKNGLEDAYNAIKDMNIAGAIGQAINGAVTFITGGGLGGILKVGGEIVHQICQGIIQNADEINKGVSSAIKQIAGWVEEHAGEIGKAGKVIIDALRTGIEDNTDGIHRAMEAVAGAMNEWVDSSAQLDSLMGNFADIMWDSLKENIASAVGGKATEIWNAITSTLMNSQPDMTKGGSGFLASILEWFFPSEASAGEKTGNEKPLQGSGKKDKTTTNLSDKLTGMNTKELEAFRTELAALQNTANEVAASVSSSFTSIQSSIRESMTGCANIVRNQMLSVTNVVRNQALNSANIIRNQFLNMTNIIRNQSINSANIVRNQFVNISNIIRSQSLNSSNIVRNQFVSMSNVIRTQMVNCSNIVRNQMVSISNVVRNQSRNARNAFTTQFISLGKVARTQITQARNSVTSQMISMANVIRTQSSNARNAFTSAMISIKNVARVQSSEAGRYIATGLAAGIRSGTSSAVAAARSMVNQVNAIVRSAAKIASPSKVTTEYGEFYGQGFGVGIKKAMPNVYRIALDSVQGLNDEIKSTVNAEISKVTVNAKASSTNNIKNQTTAIARLDNDDIEKLGDALSSRPNIMKASIGEKEIIEVVAEPVRKHIAKNDERNKRKKGG